MSDTYVQWLASMNEQRTTSWRHSIDQTLLCWEDYNEALNKLFTESTADTELPDNNALQALLSPTVRNVQGRAIQFVSPTALAAGGYEEHIFNTAKVSTRTNNWHDVFNALVWWRFPALKAAINAMHFAEIQKQAGTGRGRLRDALTLWDECGVIVTSTNGQVLEKLADRNWKGAFQDSAHLWQDDISVFICGHALLEKFLNPYKSITAHALLVQLDSDAFPTNRTSLLANLDDALASKLLTGTLLNSSADLSPLPLAGIPGWWNRCEQDDTFYADASVFRTPAAPFVRAPVVTLRNAGQVC